MISFPKHNGRFPKRFEPGEFSRNNPSCGPSLSNFQWKRWVQDASDLSTTQKMINSTKKGIWKSYTSGMCTKRNPAEFCGMRKNTQKSELLLSPQVQGTAGGVYCSWKPQQVLCLSSNNQVWESALMDALSKPEPTDIAICQNLTCSASSHAHDHHCMHLVNLCYLSIWPVLLSVSSCHSSSRKNVEQRWWKKLGMHLSFFGPYKHQVVKSNDA
jgi:hypothetical protein